MIDAKYLLNMSAISWINDRYWKILTNRFALEYFFNVRIQVEKENKKERI